MSFSAETVQIRLFLMQDLKYKAFHCSLMPTVSPETVIGVRIPQLRKFAVEFSKTEDAEDFLKILPHRYYEENNLHGFLIERINNYNRVIELLDAFLPHVNNWATCDLMHPPVFKHHLPELLDKINEWLGSGHTYTIRFGIEMLMSFYLDDQFLPEYPALVANVESTEYYVNMMIAWYFATALAKQYTATLPYLQQHLLKPWTHNKAIQKAIESYRITVEQKEYLRTLKCR